MVVEVGREDEARPADGEAMALADGAIALMVDEIGVRARRRDAVISKLRIAAQFEALEEALFLLSCGLLFGLLLSFLLGSLIELFAFGCLIGLFALGSVIGRIAGARFITGFSRLGAQRALLICV